MSKTSLQQDLGWRAMKDSLLCGLSFFGQFLREPACTGSICPSSQFLARQLVSMALEENPGNGLLVDLGAGSGVVSRELLRQGVSADAILAIDISDRFEKRFNRYSPGLKLRIGDARNLPEILARHYPGRKIRAIISSLPLRSMPGAIVGEVMVVLNTLLQTGGRLVQFTYALWQRCALERYGFLHNKAHYVALNIPPALVERYEARNQPC